ncbi:DPH2.2 family protein [Megaselia abdita]
MFNVHFQIAASHVDADSLIHFGVACKSKISRLPVHYVFPEFSFDESHLVEASSTLKEPTVFTDIGYHHVQNYIHFPFDEDYVQADSYGTCIFIGSDNERFFNLSASIKAEKWFIYNPNTKSLTEKNPLISNYIRKRYFSIEKCKDSKTLGLIVGTLTSKGYLDVIDRIKAMAKARNIKTQIISVGRVNPAKLANFLEIDCFVFIGCPFNNLHNSRDSFKPIVSVFEAEMAFNPAWHMKYPETYVLDFKDVLPNGKQFLEFKSEDVQGSDVSLVGGGIRNFTESSNEPSEIGNSLMEIKNMALMEQKNGLQFEDRSWKGLEQALGQTEPVKITMGRSGIPKKYENEE